MSLLGKQGEDALLVRLANPALGDEPGHELARGNVESEICRGAVLGSDANFDMLARVETIGMAHFFGSAFLDGDFVNAIANVPVERGRGQRHVKRNAVIFRGERLEVSAD